LDDLDEGIVGKFGDVALECPKSVLGRRVRIVSGDDRYSDVLLGLATTGDLGGISGAEPRSLWKGKAGKTFED
jgi:hypothetical protein